MMDSDLTGFVVWHIFIRAAIVLELVKTKDRLLHIDREIALGVLY